MPWDDDGLLVQQSLADDPEAFGMLVHKYQDVVYAYACQKLGDPTDAEDVTQEIFLRAYRKLDQLRSPHRFRSWLYTIMANECKRWQRRHLAARSRQVSLGDAPESAMGVEPTHDSTLPDLQADLTRAVEALPEGYRVVVSMFYQSENSVKEISEYLGVSTNTVKSKLHRARKQLGAKLMDRYGHALAQHKLKGGFLMQLLERIPGIDRPTIPPIWKGFVRHVPEMTMLLLCVVAGFLGWQMQPLEETWLDADRLPQTADAEVADATLVQLVWPGEIITHEPTPEQQSVKQQERTAVPRADGGPESTEVPRISPVTSTASTGPGQRGQMVAAAPAMSEPVTTIAGVITDTRTGQPIPNARIRLRPRDPGAATDANGRYHLQSQALSPRTYTLWVESSGYGKESVTFLVSESETRIEVNTSLSPGATITGRVLDTRGQPVQGAEVGLSNSRGSATTDALGNYTIRDVAVKIEDHSLTVRHPGFVDSGRIPIPVHRSGQSTVPDVSLADGIEVYGRVTDEAGEPVVGADVTAEAGVLYYPGGSRGQTDANGEYRFGHVPVGEGVVLVRVRPKQFAPAYRRVEAGKDASVQVDLTVTPGVSLIGRVVDENGEPLEGVRVSLSNWGKARWEGFGTDTDATGSFRLEHLPPVTDRSPTLTLLKAMYHTMEHVPVEFAPDQASTVLIVPFVMQKVDDVTRIYAQALDGETRQPVRQFIVRAGRPREAQAGDVPLSGIPGMWFEGILIPASDGRFETFQQPRNTTCALYLEAEGYAPKILPRIVFGTSSKQAPLLIEMVRGRPSYVGVVTDAQLDRPVQGAMVIAFDKDEPLRFDRIDRRLRGAPVNTDAQGRFALTSEFSLPFYLWISHPDFPPTLAGPFHDSPPQSLQIEIDDRNQSRVVGTGVPGRIIALSTEFSEIPLHLRRQTYAALDGTYSFDRLVPGEYRVSEMVANEVGAHSRPSATVVLRTGETRRVDFKPSAKQQIQQLLDQLP